jgi:hypothetical protein
LSGADPAPDAGWRALLAAPAAQIVLRSAVASAFAYGLWRAFGASGLVFAAPLFGVLLARPLIDLAGDLGRATRGLALDDIEGRHYAFKGLHIEVAEDADGRRWLRAADVRKAVPGLPADASLLHLYPAGTRRAGRRRAVGVEAETLWQALDRSSEAQTLKFRLWLEREVILPARRQRERSVRS